MKILYDHQIFSSQKVGGISRCFFELFKHFNGNPDIQYQLAVKCSPNKYLRESEIFNDGKIKFFNLTQKEFVRKNNFKGKGRLYNLLYPDAEKINTKYSIELLREGQYDVLHPTNFDPYFLEFVQDKPFVITVHDMIKEIYPEFEPLGRGGKLSEIKEQLVRKAAAVIAVSEQTKSDLLSFVDIDPSKVHVIYHGASLNCNGDCKINLPEKYLLFVGNRDKYKNFYFFVRSIKEILLRDRNLKIVCVGPSLKKEEEEFFKELDLDKQVMHVFADDQELGHVYRNALALVFPSLYEGFGLPILEAFASDCPVLLSNIKVFHEIAGDAAACYFEPKDKKSIYNAVNNFIEDRILKLELIKNRRERLKGFSWQNTAEKVLNVYEQII